MSKPVKELIRKQLIRKLDGVTSLAVLEFTGVDAITTHKIRGRLREKDIKVMVIKNSVARQAFKQIGLEGAAKMIEGPCAIAHGADSVVTVVRELLKIAKDAPNLKVKAAFLEGEVFGAERIEELSKYPTRPEAIGQLVSCILSPGSKLVACVIGAGGKLASILKAIQEKQEKKEKEGAAPAAQEVAQVA